MGDELDEAIRQAAPRAPRSLVAGVEARLAVQARARRRARRATLGVGALLAAAAALLLWAVARPPAPFVDSGWVADGRALAVGATVRGPATLERHTALGVQRARLELGSEMRVGDGALQLSAGRVRLEGPEARVVGDGTAVTALGDRADVAIELGRTTMTTKQKTAALTALVAVTVYGGGAKVLAQGHGPIVLAKNDRTLVARGLPPLTTRAMVADATPRPAARTQPTPKPVAKAKAKTPAPDAAKTPAPDAAKTPAPRSTATLSGAVDKELVREAIRANLGGIRDCYQAALKTDPKLAGRFSVNMRVVTEDGVGRVKEAEIVPAEDGYLDSMSMQQCVLQVVSRIEFPPSADGGDVMIRYPFLFASAPPDGK